MGGKFMKALILFNKGNFKLVDVEKPSIEDNKVLVKVAYSSICGSDLALIEGSYPNWTKLPVIPGHEFSGTIEEVGRNINNVQPGDEVIVDNCINCNSCYYCKKGEYFYCDNHSEPGFSQNGGFAEYCLLPNVNVVKIPKGLSLKHAAITEPTANALKACNAAEIKKGEIVLILGCGPIGLIVAMLCKSMGAKVIVLGRGERLKRFEGFNFERLIDTNKGNWVEVINESYGHYTQNWGIEAIDKFIDATQTGTLICDSIKLLKRKGKGILIGLSKNDDALFVPRNDIVIKGIKLIGSTSGQGYFYEALSCLLAGDVDAEKIITHIFPLKDALGAFEVCKKRIEGAIKVVIKNN
jgi:L-iditol 2-dehydrogenase